MFGEGLADAGKAPPGLAVGIPFLLFTGFCTWMFVGSRRRPGETPVGLFVQELGDGIEKLRGLVRKRRPAKPGNCSATSCAPSPRAC